MERIIIIGGGPSGIITSLFAKNKDNEVIILERNNKPLKKLLMTGNGKCNYLNEVYEDNCYHSQDMNIVHDLIKEDNISRVKSFFDSIGIIPKIKNGYYYPYSNQAITIEKALLKEVKDKDINIITDVYIERIEKSNNTFKVHSKDTTYECDKLVLATGSYAYPKTGSDGSGYEFLKEFKHTIIKPLPALVQLIGKDKFYKEWDGIRCEVEMELWEDDKYLSKEFGEAQLTDYGLSGICTFNLSQFVSRGLEDHKKEVIYLNFIPFVKEDISSWLETYHNNHPTKNIQELLEGFLNPKLVNCLLNVYHITTTTNYKDIEQSLLVEMLHHFKVEIIGTKDFNSCQICNGGLKLSEINTETMESILVPNLYIVGELLDMNGNCGGYNLTECWLTGLLAGTTIGEKHD